MVRKSVVLAAGLATALIVSALGSALLSAQAPATPAPQLAPAPWRFAGERLSPQWQSQPSLQRHAVAGAAILPQQLQQFVLARLVWTGRAGWCQAQDPHCQTNT